jgi:hypothetical protein
VLHSQVADGAQGSVCYNDKPVARGTVVVTAAIWNDNKVICLENNSLSLFPALDDIIYPLLALLPGLLVNIVLHVSFEMNLWVLSNDSSLTRDKIFLLWFVLN